MEDTALFASGKIYILKNPINGRLGIYSLYSRLVSMNLGIEWNGEDEIWVVMFNKPKTRMRILHVEPGYGFDLKIRVLFHDNFKAILDNSGYQTITREQLQQLSKYGYYSHKNQ